MEVKQSMRDNGKAGGFFSNMSLKGFRDNIKDYFKKIKTAEVSNHELALGFAIGTFIAILPTPGFGIFIAIFLAYLFRKINKPSILLSFVVWNPLFMSPVHFFSYKIGNLITHDELEQSAAQSLINQIMNFGKEYLFGNFILAVILSVISYFIIFQIVAYLKKRHVLIHNEIRETL